MGIKEVWLKLIEAILSAIRPAIQNIVWLLKLMLPITLGISIAQYLGLITWFSHFLSPAMGMIGLDGSASLAFISAIFANLYTAIAVMASLNLDFRSVTILATMCLIAHNLIIETIIQRKTGSSGIYMVALRIGSALVTAFVLNLILPQNFTGVLRLVPMSEHIDSWFELFTSWLYSLVPLMIKVVSIVGSLQILQNVLKAFNLIDMLTYPLRPLVKAMGMKSKMTFLWIVANTLGLGYGGAVLYEEVRKGEFNKEEVDGLNTSIAITHSLLEDTTLFAVIGVGLPWLIIPRMLVSTIALWTERFVRSRLSIFAYQKNT